MLATRLRRPEKRSDASYFCGNEETSQGSPTGHGPPGPEPNVYNNLLPPLAGTIERLAAYNSLILSTLVTRPCSSTCPTSPLAASEQTFA